MPADSSYLKQPFVKPSDENSKMIPNPSGGGLNLDYGSTREHVSVILWFAPPSNELPVGFITRPP